MSQQPQSRILVVEDDRINRMLLETRLCERGYAVVLVESGGQAIDLLQSALKGEADPVDMVLLDVMMPGMDGIEVLRKIREQASAIDLPVIMVTAKGQSGDVVEALEFKANDYVTKPIDFDVLFVRMAAHLDLKATHQALRTSQVSLIHAAKMETLGYLAAGMAHEIRNPLAQIQLAVDALRRVSRRDASGETTVTKEKLFDGIESAVARADEIVKGLVHYSDSKGLQLSKCDLHGLISDVLLLLTQEVLQQSVDVHLQFCPGKLEAVCAGEEMRQVLVNVLLNAIQAMPGGGELVIRTSESVAGKLQISEGMRSGAGMRSYAAGTLIEIVDSGPGVSQRDLSRIFDPFFTSRPTGSGTGLGLTVAHKLMELQGGIIEIRNRDDGQQGLRVKLMLQKTSSSFV